MSQHPSFRAIVADDHKLLRTGIVQILEAHGAISVVAEAEDGLQTIALVKQHRPDLLTLDIAMPFAQGIAIYGEVMRWSPETRVIVFSGITSASLLQELLDAGVEGLFTKRGDVGELERAIPIILGGGKVVSSDAAQLIESGQASGTLTTREKQVLSCIAQGHSTKGVAEQLGISVKTVDNHRTNLMAKLGVRSMAELLAYALKEGLLDSHREL